MSEESSSSIPKWQIGLAVGVPIAALCVGAFLYYRWSRKSPSSSPPPDTLATAVTVDKPADNQGQAPADSEGKPRDGDDDDEKEHSSHSEDESQEYKSPTTRARESKDKGNKHFKEGRFEKAVECYTRAINLSPTAEQTDLAVYHHNRAAAYDQLSAKARGEEKEKFLKEVLADCTEALKCNPRYLKALVRRAKVSEVFEDFQLAVRDLTAACLLESFQNARTMQNADRVLKELGQRKAKEMFKNRKKELPSVLFIDQYLDSFDTYRLVDNVVEDGEIGASPAETEEPSSGTDPGSADYQEALTSVRKCDYDNVLEKCSSAIEKGLSGDLANALVLRGTFNLLKMEHEDALRDFSQVLSMGEDKVSTKLRVHTLLKRCSVYQAEDRQSDAKSDFARALKLDPADSDVYHHHGQLHVAENNLEAAIEDYTKAVELNNSSVHNRIQLGYVQYKLAVMQQSQEMLLKAEKTFKEIVNEFPKSGEAHNVYGQMLLDRQDVQQATEMFEKALELNPGNATPWVHKGLMLIQFGQDMDGGIALIEKAGEVDPKCEFAFETLAAFEIQKGNIDRAIELFEKAMSLVRSESELAQSYSLCEAAVIQRRVTTELGISPAMPWGSQPMFSMM